MSKGFFSTPHIPELAIKHLKDFSTKRGSASMTLSTKLLNYILLCASSASAVSIFMKHTASLPCTRNNTYKGVEADLRFALLKALKPCLSCLFDYGLLPYDLNHSGANYFRLLL